MGEKPQRAPVWMIIFEGAGLVLIFAGLITEILFAADIFYIVITAGSLVIASGAFLMAKVLPRR